MMETGICAASAAKRTWAPNARERIRKDGVFNLGLLRALSLVPAPFLICLVHR